MGKKRHGHPDVEDVLGRPWCYYCERDFEDLKLLISHQKAKHFKCDRCGRRLNTAGGLSVHLNQVHKETLHQVENALPNRQGLDVEIFGMEGIPQDILDQHRNRIIQNFYQAQEDRRIATGNPLPGQAGQNTRKKIKMETKEELLTRLREWRAMKNTDREAAATGVEDGAAPGSAAQTQSQPQQGFEQPGYPGQLQHGQPPYAYPATALPSRVPGALGPPPGLPQRPSEGLTGSQVSAAAGDDIDKMIRMAEAGVKTAQKPEEAAEGDKKSKKEKKGRLVYDDADISPEEKMAAMPRYAFTPEAAAA
ncbi:RING-6 like protein [Hirsutella rhossiliensis]|uniref:RING-6 like protein n=1 Tax=Hirsutella rhossiliensis TaxID=111463 RepID=A0A9P8N9N8_9HYPO|nr:RING-6 like protein [Hirsutella rhossiliensis]KAH0968561.1 RING-6 like protein [Hirsutella rhossiliensis]